MYESSKTPDWKVLHSSALSRACRKTNSTRIRIVWHGEKVNGANFPEVIPQECSPGLWRRRIQELLRFLLRPFQRFMGSVVHPFAGHDSCCYRVVGGRDGRSPV